MPRFTLPKALASLTYCCVAAAMFRPAIHPYEWEFRLLYFLVCCVTALLSVGVLINEIELSVLFGILIAVVIAIFTAIGTFLP